MRIDSNPIDISLASAMITRSAKAAQRGSGLSSPISRLSVSSPGSGRRSTPLAGPSSSSPSTRRKRREPTDEDLEEELERPTKEDYNAVRKALIGTRAISEHREIELQNTKAQLAKKDSEFAQVVSELSKCIETHGDRIKELEETLKEYKRKEEERNTEESGDPGPREQMDTENEEPKSPTVSMREKLASQIDAFATQYFGKKLQKPLVVEPSAGWAADFMQATTPGRQTYMDYLHSRRRCPLIIKAFIWRFLCANIFNAAPWSGSEEIRLHVEGLQKILSKCR